MFFRNTYKYFFYSAGICLYVIFLFSCQTADKKLFEDANTVFEKYKTCYAQQDFECIVDLLDSATTAYYQTILDTVASHDDQYDFTDFAKDMPFKRLTTIYAYSFQAALKNKSIRTNDLSDALEYLYNQQLLGHDFTNANHLKLDHDDGSHIWSFAGVIGEEGNTKRRLEYERENGQLKFSFIYRNSLVDLRLVQHKLDTEILKYIVRDKILIDDKPAKKQFERLLNVMAI